jgi:hypothetical protein
VNADVASDVTASRQIAGVVLANRLNAGRDVRRIVELPNCIAGAKRQPAASTARPIGLSNVRTSVERPSPLAHTANSLLAWYVLTSSDAFSSRSSATKPSVCVK